ncbi:MAG: hypothetical protein ACJAT2_000564 [Bacteriovoracaceae bacterium]|jgi:uncharacterized protein (TIGR02147 family)
MSHQEIQEPIAPIIFNYLSAHEFLSDFLRFKKEINHRVSVGSLALAIGFKSKASLHHYLSGERTPKGEHLRALLDYFKFTKAEEKHFLNLVELQTINPLGIDSSELLRSKLRRSRSHQTRSVDKKILNVAFHWLHFSVKELLSSSKKIQSLKELKSLFRLKDNGLLLGEVIDDLSSLGLISHDEKGNLTSPKDIQKTKEEGQNLDIQKYHSEVLDLGKTALSEVSPDERYFSSITFQGDLDKFNRLKSFIKELEKECLVNDEDASRVEVYHCNIQLYPVTQSNTKEKLH